MYRGLFRKDSSFLFLEGVRWSARVAMVLLDAGEGVSFDYEKGRFNKVVFSWQDGAGKIDRTGDFSRHRHQIVAWDKIALRNAQ